MKDLTAPNVLTLLALSSGFVSVLASSRGAVAVAVTAIVVAMVLDRLDGIVARRLGQTSELGGHLDSLSDLVSFGVAPAVLVAVTSETLWIEATAVAWAAAAAWRLARFHEDGVVAGCFVGVPTPAAAVWLLLAYVFLPAWVVGGLVLVGATGMVSRFPYPKGGPLLGVTVVAIATLLAGSWLS